MESAAKLATESARIYHNIEYVNLGNHPSETFYSMEIRHIQAFCVTSRPLKFLGIINDRWGIWRTEYFDIFVDILAHCGTFVVHWK